MDKYNCLEAPRVITVRTDFIASGAAPPEEGRCSDHISSFSIVTKLAAVLQCACAAQPDRQSRAACVARKAWAEATRAQEWQGKSMQSCQATCSLALYSSTLPVSLLYNTSGCYFVFLTCYMYPEGLCGLSCHVVTNSNVAGKGGQQSCCQGRFESKDRAGRW